MLSIGLPEIVHLEALTPYSFQNHRVNFSIEAMLRLRASIIK